MGELRNSYVISVEKKNLNRGLSKQRDASEKKNSNSLQMETHMASKNKELQKLKTAYTNKLA